MIAFAFAVFLLKASDATYHVAATKVAVRAIENEGRLFRVGHYDCAAKNGDFRLPGNHYRRAACRNKHVEPSAEQAAF